MTWRGGPAGSPSIHIFSILDETQINLCPGSLKWWDPLKQCQTSREIFIILVVLLSKSPQTLELVIFTFVQDFLTICVNFNRPSLYQAFRTLLSLTERYNKARVFFSSSFLNKSV